MIPFWSYHLTIEFGRLIFFPSVPKKISPLNPDALYVELKMGVSLREQITIIDGNFRGSLFAKIVFYSVIKWNHELFDKLLLAIQFLLVEDPSRIYLQYRAVELDAVEFSAYSQSILRSLEKNRMFISKYFLGSVFINISILKI